MHQQHAIGVLRLPEWDELSRKSQIAFSTASKNLRDLSCRSPVDDKAEEALYFEYVDHFRNDATDSRWAPFIAVGADARPNCSVTEFFSRRLKPSISIELSMRADCLVEQDHSPGVFFRRCGVKQFRLSEVFTEQSADGARRRYPAISNIAQAMSTLQEFTNSGDLPVAFQAFCAMVSFLNIHPVADGNGRFARELFRQILRANGIPRRAFPIEAIIFASDGGFEVLARLAEDFGTWDLIADLALRSSSQVLSLRSTRHKNPLIKSSCVQDRVLDIMSSIGQSTKPLLPVFLTCVSDSTYYSASPYIIPLSKLQNDYGNSRHRRRLIIELRRFLISLEQSGRLVRAIMLGGSFLRPEIEPRDIDVVILYSASSEVGPVPSMNAGVDASCYPMDATLTLTIKAIAFHSLLFSQDRSGGPSKGFVLLDYPSTFSLSGGKPVRDPASE